MGSPSRRRVLRLVAAGLPLVGAGCSSEEPPSTQTSAATPVPTDTESTPTDDGTPAPLDTENGAAGPAPSCPDGVESFDPGWVVAGNGPLGGFELSCDPTTLGLGETLTVTLDNVTSEPQTAGNRRKFDLQYDGSDGWHTVFGSDGGVEWTDIGVDARPGQVFEWSFELSRPGLERFLDGLERTPYSVCGPIETGDYRFVYWGITSEREEYEDFETDYALGVRFSIS